MKIEVAQELKTYNGKSIITVSQAMAQAADSGDEAAIIAVETAGKLTFQTAVAVAITQHIEKDKEGKPTLTGQAKFLRNALATKLHLPDNDGFVDLTEKEVELIRKVTGDFYETPTVGPVWDALDKAEEAEEVETAEPEL